MRIMCIAFCVIVFGCIGIGITGRIATMAEQRLISEENIAIANNKQILATKQALADYEKFKTDLANQ